MVVEHALLRIREGQSAAFESAMVIAKPLIAASPGFLNIEVRRAVEQADLYLLLVEWESVADHRDGFRHSARYAEWREIRHGFYEPMPDVAYFGEAV